MALFALGLVPNVPRLSFLGSAPTRKLLSLPRFFKDRQPVTMEEMR